MNRFVAVLMTVCMSVFASVADQPHSAPAVGKESTAGTQGWTEYLRAFELFMAGDLPAARTAFEQVFHLKDGRPDYVASAGIQVGLLQAIMNDPGKAREAYEQVSQMKEAPLAYRADARSLIARMLFEAGEVTAASNMLQSAVETLGKDSSSDAEKARSLLNNCLGYIRQNQWGDRKSASNRGWTDIEMKARRTVNRRQVEALGLTQDRCYLKGKMVAGPYERYPAYPEAYFPYQWDFANGSLCGISYTNGLANLRVESGCLKARTEKGAVFGWGRLTAGETQKGLRIGYGSGFNVKCPRMWGLRMRLRQSLEASEWQMRVASMARGLLSTSDSGTVTVKGTNWQEVLIPISGGSPPYAGVQLVTGTSGNDIEIDWVKPYQMAGPVTARKEIVVPARVRWARVSIIVHGGTGRAGGFCLYVNGQEAVVSPPRVNGMQMWNYELKPEWFKEGRNVLAMEVDGGEFLLDGALLCEDGTYLRFDSDPGFAEASATWRAGLPEKDANWTTLEYNDHAWAPIRLLKLAEPLEDQIGGPSCSWFNPSWKGRLKVSPVDGRHQPVFGSKDEVALRVEAPAKAGDTPEVTWVVYDEMGDGVNALDRKVREGTLPLAAAGGIRGGRLCFAAGELPYNRAYAVEFRLKINGEGIEQYRYELAVCGPVTLPTVENPTNYTDGMELKLVWECDAAADPRLGEFVSCDGRSQLRPSSVIKTPLGRFRQPYSKENLGSGGGGPCNYISFVYTIKNPGRPHVAIADYPDDTERCQEMRITEGGYVDGGRGTEIGNDTVMLGLGNPLTHEMRQHHCIFFPGCKRGTVTFFSLGWQGKSWDSSLAARVGKIRIYEILNDVPARQITDAPGPLKWVGQLAEAGPREIFQSCFSSPVAGYMRRNLIVSETPNFYRNWMIAFVNMVKRMKFAGENAYYCGQYMYSAVLYPSAFSDTTALEGSVEGGSLRDYGGLMAKMFEENNLGFFSALQLWAPNRFSLSGDNQAIADGLPTFAQVDHQGKQTTVLRGVHPNWLKPEARGYYETIINELVALYGREPGWKGIVIQMYNVMGPGWFSPETAPWSAVNDKDDNPWFASYDDYTIALFQKETGIRVPVADSDSQRFSKRHAWLLDKAKTEWTDWRCKKISEFQEWTRDRVKAARPDLELIYYPLASYIAPPWDERPKEALPSIFDYARRGGMDLEKIKNDSAMTLAVNVETRIDFDAWNNGAREVIGKGRFLSRRDRSLTPFANDGKNGLAIRYSWYEAQPSGPPGWLWNFTSPESWPYPQDDYFADYWINGFIRTNPRLILHPLQDLVVWNGRETSMSRFAQAFRSLPAIPYVKLTGNGRDRNVWISFGTYAGQTYGYVANPYWWELDVRLEVQKGLKGRELTTDTVLANGEWRGRLKPYTMRTFRFDGVHTQAIAACTAQPSEKGKSETERLLAAWKQDLESNRSLMQKTGRENELNEFSAVIREARAALDAGDYGAAYDRLTTYPSQRLRMMVNDQPFSPFIVDEWGISKLIPRDQRALTQLDPAQRDDATMEWRPVEVTGSNRILAHSQYPGQDGFVYFANRIRAPVGGSWTLCVGHDGGCRVFVDGQPVLSEPRRRNPIREDRTKATIELQEGEHDVVVAFDTDHGMGYGFVLRFQPPEGTTRKGIEFPFAVMANTPAVNEPDK